MRHETSLCMAHASDTPDRKSHQNRAPSLDATLLCACSIESAPTEQHADRSLRCVTGRPRWPRARALTIYPRGWPTSVISTAGQDTRTFPRQANTATRSAQHTIITRRYCMFDSSVAGRDPRVRPWAASFDEEAWIDLVARVRHTRWPSMPDDPDWSLGSDPKYLRNLADYWASEFDWAASLASANRHSWFETRLKGPTDSTPVTVRFIHVRAAASGRTTRTSTPILLCHGWPDSAWRYSDVIDRLSDPAAFGGDPSDAFDVVVPDMPGFGYSALPDGVSLNALDVARLWIQLMRELGYSRYVVAGGDIGSSVSRFVALEDSAHAMGVHRMDAGVPVFTGSPQELTDEEREWMADAAAWGGTEGAYAALHRTKPGTAAVALSDSPIGLAAWIVEKLRFWGDTTEFDMPFSPDAVLSLVTTTWMNNSIGPAMRMYRANAKIPASEHARRVEVPSGFSLFAGDLLAPPRSWLERIANVVRVTYPERGGHFAPREVPELYAEELRDFVRSLG